MSRPQTPVTERFWNRVDKTLGHGPKGECWVWVAGHDGYGYGAIRYKGKSVVTHRVSWEMANGLIPDGMKVLHRCDNPPCVNPDHLFLGTHQDNMADMKEKKRYANRHTKRTVAQQRV